MSRQQIVNNLEDILRQAQDFVNTLNSTVPTKKSFSTAATGLTTSYYTFAENLKALAADPGDLQVQFYVNEFFDTVTNKLNLDQKSQIRATSLQALDKAEQDFFESLINTPGTFLAKQYSIYYDDLLGDILTRISDLKETRTKIVESLANGTLTADSPLLEEFHTETAILQSIILSLPNFPFRYPDLTPEQIKQFDQQLIDELKDSGYTGLDGLTTQGDFQQNLKNFIDEIETGLPGTITLEGEIPQKITLLDNQGRFIVTQREDTELLDKAPQTLTISEAFQYYLHGGTPSRLLSYNKDAGTGSLSLDRVVALRKAIEEEKTYQGKLTKLEDSQGEKYPSGHFDEEFKDELKLLYPDIFASTPSVIPTPEQTGATLVSMLYKSENSGETPALAPLLLEFIQSKSDYTFAIDGKTIDPGKIKLAIETYKQLKTDYETDLENERFRKTLLDESLETIRERLFPDSTSISNLSTAQLQQLYRELKTYDITQADVPDKTVPGEVIDKFIDFKTTSPEQIFSNLLQTEQKATQYKTLYEQKLTAARLPEDVLPSAFQLILEEKYPGLSSTAYANPTEEQINTVITELQNAQERGLEIDEVTVPPDAIEDFIKSKVLDYYSSTGIDLLASGGLVNLLEEAIP